MTALNKTWRRWGLAISLSVGIFCATWTYSHAINAGLVHASRLQALAKLTKKSSAVQVRAADDVIWQALDVNENIYGGDLVRTGIGGSADIQFLAQQASIHLEESSQVVIEENAGQVGINFIDGRLLVDSAVTGESKIGVRAGDRQIDLKKNQLSLDKRADGQVDLTLLSGELEKDQISDSLKQQLQAKIQLLEPLSNSTKLVLSGDEAPVRFTWKLVSNATDEGLEFWIGPNPNRLQLYSKLPAKQDHLENKLKAGNYYWQLRTKNRESGISEFVVKELNVPELLSPISGAQLSLEGSDLVHFEWKSDVDWAHLQLQISEQINFAKLLFSQDVTGRQSFQWANPSFGRKYWRLQANLDQEAPVYSKSLPFISVQKPSLSQAIELLRPYDKEVLSVSAMEQDGVRIVASGGEGPGNFELSLNNLKTKKSETLSSTQARWWLKNLSPGSYEWSIRKGKQSSEVRHFEILPLEAVTWKDLRQEVYFATVKPELNLKWNPLSQSVKEWHVHIFQKDKASSDERWIVKSTSVQKILPAAGEYWIELQAINEAGELIGQSEMVSVFFKQAPMLPAPKMDRGTLFADDLGHLSLRWQPVTAGKEYLVQLQDDSGSQVQTYRTAALTAAFKNLKPGHYRISVKAVSSDGTEGISSEQLDAVINERSVLAAPKSPKVSFDDE